MKPATGPVDGVLRAWPRLRGYFSGRTQLAEAELLALRLLAATDQMCLDSGWKTAWGLTGLPEPGWSQWAQIDGAILRRTHGSSRLVNETWVATEVQRLKDVAFLMKQRQGGGNGDGKGNAAAAR